MHRKLVAASLLVAALAALGALGASADSVVAQDPFIALIKEVEVQPFFPQLSETHRLLTFEMLTAAETNHLGQLLDLLGYIQLFKYLDALPKEFSHRFITYSITLISLSRVERYADFMETNVLYTWALGTRAGSPVIDVSAVPSSDGPHRPHTAVEDIIPYCSWTGRWRNSTELRPVFPLVFNFVMLLYSSCANKRGK